MAGAFRAATTSSFILLVSGGFLLTLFAALIAALIFSLIPTYLSSSNITPSGEEYCIGNLQINVSTTSTVTPVTTLNSSYLLSLACYRILQNYKTDSLLKACLISNCSIISPAGTTLSNTSCNAVIYYSARCRDEAPTYGLYSFVNASSNSACRKKRMTNINGALGATGTTYTNVPFLLGNSSTNVSVSMITTTPFSSYSQQGAYYCGAISQSAIASVVNLQATGQSK